jgi:GTP cyclohydrolase III
MYVFIKRYDTVIYLHKEICLARTHHNLINNIKTCEEIWIKLAKDKNKKPRQVAENP